MYKQHLDHKILAEIRNDFPFLKIGVKFNDLFSEDTYMIISDGKYRNLKRIPFSVYKNNEPLKECEMINLNMDKLLDDVFSDIEDYDLKQIFFRDHKQKIVNEIASFMQYYDEQILLNEITIEGELRRMKEIAGMNKKIIY